MEKVEPLPGLEVQPVKPDSKPGLVTEIGLFAGVK
jgi:hypothetical protein